VSICLYVNTRNNSSMDTAKYRKQLGAHWDEDWTRGETKWRTGEQFGGIGYYRDLNFSPFPGFPTTNSLREIDLGITPFKHLSSSENIAKASKAIEKMDKLVNDHVNYADYYYQQQHLANHYAILNALDKIDAEAIRSSSFGFPDRTHDAIKNLRFKLTRHWNEDWDFEEAKWARRCRGGDLRGYREHHFSNHCNYDTKRKIELSIEHGRKGDMTKALTEMSDHVYNHISNKEIGRSEHLATHDLLVAALDKLAALPRARGICTLL
jgi:hypothetical protein